MVTERTRISSVQFRNFKAFGQYSIQLQEINLLVGPNNSGKSTILNSFRVLAAGLRRAYAKSAEPVPGPGHEMWGHRVPTDDIPMSFENVHNNYDTSNPATITFNLTNKNKLILFFNEEGRCTMIPESVGGSARSPSTFRRQFPLSIGFVPVLGPLEHNEPRVEKETVTRNLFTHRASRHFRNFWRYYPEDFDKFAELLRNTWPGMEIQPPEIHTFETISMFVEENRIPRELFWAGFGFQIWCQLLTHIVRSSGMDLLIVDEPEIYLHPDLQRQILSVLRDAGPDIILATHSTEIMTEADPQEIVLIDKTRKSGRRLRDTTQVQDAINVLGSRQNITLTQLARTRRVLFVEGNDFKILGGFARILNLDSVANQSEFTVVATDGFAQWPKLESLRWGFEKTLGETLTMGAIFDRDYRCDEETAAIRKQLRESLRFVHFHTRKELENYLLIPTVIDRLVKRKIRDYARQRGLEPEVPQQASELLADVTDAIRTDVQAQYIDNRVRYFKSSREQSSAITRDAIRIFDTKWEEFTSRLEIVPGKQVFGELNRVLQERHKISLTPASVLAECRPEEIPPDLSRMLKQISTVFRA